MISELYHVFVIFSTVFVLRIVSVSKRFYSTFDSSQAAIYAVRGGDLMFKRKKDLRVLELNAAERRLLIRVMMHFRNKLTALNRPTEDVNEILLRVL